MAIAKKAYGVMPGGKEVFEYTITNKNGAYVSVINSGATITNIVVPDKAGKPGGVVLGYDTLEEYMADGEHHGRIIGRFANRINEGKFTLNQTEYKLSLNDGPNTLHGGPTGFGTRFWDIAEDGDNALICTYVSGDGEENYPGRLEIKVVYTFTDEGSLKIEYTAKSDKDTIANFTNHAYFNLSGQASGSILNHEIKINADAFTPVHSGAGIPTGEIRPVEGTPFDFRKSAEIGSKIDSGYDQITYGAGAYDHNFCVNGEGFRQAAVLYSKESGRVMEVYTDLPGIQLYTGNFMTGKKGKDGAKNEKNFGLCLETQLYPDCINHENFKSPILRAGETFKSVTEYRFSIK